MYRRIMVPLDGSSFSERALPLAVALADRSGAELRLVHVLVPFANRVFIETEGGGPDYLADVAHRITEESGVPTEAVRLVGRQVVGELSYYSAEEGVDLVVMATHGWGGLQRAWLGSVTDGLVREARVPVVAFRPGEEEGPRVDGKVIEEILIPLDGSAVSEGVVEEALRLGGRKARYTLVRVIPVGPPSVAISGAMELAYRQELVDALRTGAEQYLADEAARLRREGYEVRTEVLMHPQPARAILDRAGEVGADLIAMGTHGRSGLGRLALGSVTDKVLRGADIPVLVLRPEAVEREGAAVPAAGEAKVATMAVATGIGAIA
jgi:nucleotide-binding universal stress UspA family protein